MSLLHAKVPKVKVLLLHALPLRYFTERVYIDQCHEHFLRVILPVRNFTNELFPFNLIPM